MDAEIYEKLLNGALRFVSFRPRSEKEIRDYLLKVLKKYQTGSVSDADTVFNRLTELGYADDLKFALWWISARVSTKPKGFKLIKYELLEKGVKSGIIDLALNNFKNSPDRDPDIEIIAARKAIRSKLPLYAKLPPNEAKIKVYSYLSRRGFDSDTIRRIIDENFTKDYNTNQ
jgi:regulatory protein